MSTTDQVGVFVRRRGVDGRAVERGSLSRPALGLLLAEIAAVVVTGG